MGQRRDYDNVAAPLSILTARQASTYLDTPTDHIYMAYMWLGLLCMLEAVKAFEGSCLCVSVLAYS